MRGWKFLALSLILVTLAGATACNPFGANAKADQLKVEAVRGDIAVKVNGTGKTEVATEARLSFAGTGKIARLYVKKGDTVTKGMKLAELETKDMALALTQAKVALTRQQVAVTQAELGVKNAEHALSEARDQYTWPDIKIAQANVDDAKAYIDYCETNLDDADSAGREASWTATLIYAQARLDAAEAKLDAMVKSYDTEEVAIKKLEVTLAEQTLALNRQAVAQAEETVQQAQRQLDEAVITAPFAGLVADVLPEEGDTITPETRVFYLIDPSSMEIGAEIDEMDAHLVTAGQKVVVALDAAPDDVFEGIVTAVSRVPVATPRVSGTVVYEARVGMVAPPPFDLRVGLNANVDVIVKESRDAVLVPSKAINHTGDDTVVEVWDGQVAKDTPVLTGLTDGDRTEIISGLNPGDTVIIKAAS